MTIRDVARFAGVGIKTVSRVINGEPNVAAPTADRVHRAIAQLRWEPDVRARNLRRTDSRTFTMGVLVGSLSNPFAAEVLHAIEQVAAHRGYAAFATSLDEEADRERQAVSAFSRQRVDGIVLMPIAPSQAYLQADLDRGLALVCVDREPSGIAVPSVRSDSRTAAVVATRHLLRRGHRRIALLHDREDIWTARERRQGFFDATRAAGLSAEDCPVAGGLRDPEASGAAMVALARSAAPPTAVICATDLITMGAIRALQRLGLHTQIAVVGVDDFGSADLLDPGVTVVAQRPSQIGRLAADRLFGIIDGSQPGLGGPIEVATDLIERGSGEISPPHSSR